MLYYELKNKEKYSNVYGVFTYEKYINKDYDMTHGPHHATIEVFNEFVAKRIVKLCKE